MLRKIEADLTFFSLIAIVVISAIGISNAYAAGARSTVVVENEKDDLASDHQTVPTSTWNAISATCDVVLEKHINPPAKQQLILAAAKAMYYAHGGRPPSSLATEVSGFTTDKQFRGFLDAHWKLSQQKDRKTVGQVEEILLTALIKSFDPRGRLVPPKTLRIEKQLSENRYVGIGIRLEYEDGHAVITDPIIGGTARKAGSRKGDIILEIDGKTTDGMNLGQIVDTLRGDLGTKVSVKVKNKHSGKVHVMDMVRDKVPIPTVHGVKRNDDDSWNYAIREGKKLAYLRFDRIVGSTAAEVKTLAAEIDEQGFEHVILDLRVGNDIDFHHAFMLADSLAGDHVLGRLQNSKQGRVLRTRDDHCLKNKKVYVIANPNVVGAELVVLTALRLSGATFVGQRVASDCNVGERIDINDEVGAIANVSTSVFRPVNIKTRHQNNRDVQVAITAYGAVRYLPDFESPLNAVIPTCIELFDKGITDKGITDNGN